MIIDTGFDRVNHVKSSNELVMNLVGIFDQSGIPFDDGVSC